MEIRPLLDEILGGRDISNWNEYSEDIAYNNWKNNRVSLDFNTVYNNILSNAPRGSYLEWVRNHNNKETVNFRRRIKYRYDKFRNVREIVMYLHENNYLAGKHGSPTPNQVEDLIGKFYIWYRMRSFNDDENKVLGMFLDNQEEVEDE